MYAVTLTAARRIDRAAADAALHLTFVALVALVASAAAPLALVGAAFYLGYCGLDWFMDGCMSDILGIAPPAGRIYGARDYDPAPAPDTEPAPESIPPVVAPAPTPPAAPVIVTVDSVTTPDGITYIVPAGEVVAAVAACSPVAAPARKPRAPRPRKPRLTYRPATHVRDGNAYRLAAEGETPTHWHTGSAFYPASTPKSYVCR